MSMENSISRMSESATSSPSQTLLDDGHMRTIVFSSQKGGSGKTTLCGQLAVQAELAGMGPVAIIDTDPQGSLADWWNVREAETPRFVKTCVDRLYEDLQELHSLGIKLVFIDCQPAVTDVITQIVRMADLVVIPTRPSPHDLRAVGPTMDLVEKCNKPMIFLVNSATPRARITGDVAVALSQHGTVAPVTVHHRNDFATSMINGKTVMETNPSGASAKEIVSLWDYLSARLSRLQRSGDKMTFDTPAVTAPAHAMPAQEPVEQAYSGLERRDPNSVGFERRNTAAGFGRRKIAPAQSMVME